jgi:hypothetical protein
MRTVFAGATALILSAAIAAAQDVPKTAAAEPADAAAGLAGLGEIMSVQQMRHIKLWFAGHAGNWPLADYEVDELKEGFDDVTKLLGGDIVAQHVGAAIADLEKAIDGKNRSAFEAAYDKLSAGCNACHHTLDHGFIAIQRPSALPYSDQVFTPPK